MSAVNPKAPAGVIQAAQRAVDLINYQARVVDVIQRSEPFTVELVLKDAGGATKTLVISGDMGSRIIMAWGHDDA